MEKETNGLNEQNKPEQEPDYEIRSENDDRSQDERVKDFERTAEEANAERTKKPGSQSNSSDQNNNGRGGGK